MIERLVNVDGTHIKANASKHKCARYNRAEDLDKTCAREMPRRAAVLEKARIE